jgi:hypothetical protein
MPRRKRTATIMGTSAEISGAGAEHGTAGSDDVSSRAVLQSRPNPPAKRMRSSGQRDKEKPSSGSRKAQELLKVRPPAAAAAISLPPEIWRSIGQIVNSSHLRTRFLGHYELMPSQPIDPSSSNLKISRQSLPSLPQYIYSHTPRPSHNQP